MRGVVQVGNDVETSRWSAEMAAVEPRMLAAVALHPNDAPDYAERGELDDALAVIAELAGRPRVRAVGETGLDFFRTEEGPRRDAQFRSFEAHIEIAKQNDLALQIHDRDAHARRRRHAEAGRRPRAHGLPLLLRAMPSWRSSAPTTAGTCRSPAPSRSRTPSRSARRCVAAPRSLIMVETDAPFLTPTPFRGRPNAPYLIPHTLRAMADTIGTDASTLAAQISSNTELVYGRWDAEPVAPPPTTPHRDHRVTRVRLLGPAEIRDLAELLDVTPTKKLGQNFVIDAQHRAAHRAGRRGRSRATSSWRSGPASGRSPSASSRRMRRSSPSRSTGAWPRSFPRRSRPLAPEAATRLTVLHQDALTVTELPAEPTQARGEPPVQRVRAGAAALPRALPAASGPGVVMVQAEVGYRVAAEPGSKVYGAPSVKAAWYGSWRTAGTVSRQVFWPVPNVDSVLVGVRAPRGASRATRNSADARSQLVDAAFQQRRKMLRQALSPVFGDSATATAALEAAGLAPTLRGEQLGIAEFVALARARVSASAAAHM